MKRNKIIYSALLSCLLAVSACQDFLNVPPSDLLSSEAFYETPAQCELGVIGVYAGLSTMSDEEFLYLSEVRSDNVWVSPEASTVREESELGAFRADYDLPVFNDMWNHWYKLIYDANIALKKIPACDFGNREAFKNQLLGEVYFLRGWAYFELVRLYGNIPVIDSPMSANEVAKIPQSSGPDVYKDIIIPDLKRAIDLLPHDAGLQNQRQEIIAGQGRANKIAARAMLGRVYMTMSGFPVNDPSTQSLAEAELDSVLTYAQTKNKYWAPDSTEWKKQWMAEYNNKYSIFAIQHRVGGTGNQAIFNFGRGLPPSLTTWKTSGNSIYGNKSLVYEFTRKFTKGNDDCRGFGTSLLASFAKEGSFIAHSIERDTVLVDGNVLNIQSNAILYKYTNSKPKRKELGLTADIETSMLDYNDWPVNCPVIRLEDMMLLKAEILVSKGLIGDAMAIVNKIRTRAGCDPEATDISAEKALSFVKRERQLELFCEGVRWFDIVRWNEWQTRTIAKFNRYNNPPGTDVNNVNAGKYLCPIPMTQILIKPGFYQQNAGY